MDGTTQEETTVKLCACGCGKVVLYKNSIYAPGHHPNSHVVTEKMREAGHLAWETYLKGRKHTEETKKHMSESRKGRGNQYTRGAKNILHVSEERKAFLREHLKGHENPFYGKKHTTESLAKMSEAQAKRVGERAAAWKGGISFQDYPQVWTAQLKNTIKQRDGFACQICFRTTVRFTIHHINYIKTDCLPKNLITLCDKCHGKTNGRRVYWMQLLSNVTLVR